MMRPWRSQAGTALVTVLAFMALTVPLVTAALGLASTLSIDSRVKGRILRSHYAALGATEYTIYRLVYESGYASGLAAGSADTYTLTLNGQEVTVSVLKVSNPSFDVPPSPADNSRRLQTSKVVTPGSASPNTLTNFSYTITVENRDNEPENLRKIHDLLPGGFSYVPGSSSGVTASDPSISGQELTWNLSTQQLTLQPGQWVTLSFQAQASVGAGNYCNEAWAEPGGDKTSSGKTAWVVVGTPPNELCQGAAVQVTKEVSPRVAPGGVSTTYTYTIAVENLGTAVLNMSLVRDLLPVGFLYVSGSASGDITSADPTTFMSSDRQRLDWSFTPEVQVEPGQTRTLAFRAQASAAPGDYWNEAWVTFDEFANAVYTWPTALVRVMGVFETVASTTAATASSQVWVGSDTYAVAQWQMSR